MGSFFHLSVGQLVDEVLGQSRASLESVASNGDVLLDGARYMFTIAFCRKTQRVDTSDNQIVNNALGTLLRQDVVVRVGVTRVGVRGQLNGDGRVDLQGLDQALQRVFKLWLEVPLAQIVEDVRQHDGLLWDGFDVIVLYNVLTEL